MLMEQSKDRVMIADRTLFFLLLKAYTVVEWVVGEGKALSDPHYDADDLLMELHEYFEKHEIPIKDSNDANSTRILIEDRLKSKFGG